MVALYLVSAAGDDSLAQSVVEKVAALGHSVEFRDSVEVGQSILAHAHQALTRGMPVILCATRAAAGSEWVYRLVNAANGGGEARLFALKMEADVYLGALTFDERPADWYKDPDRAVLDLMSAIERRFPERQQSDSAPDEPTADYMDVAVGGLDVDHRTLHAYLDNLRDELRHMRDYSTVSDLLGRLLLVTDRGTSTRSTALLFGVNPQIHVPGAIVQCAYYDGTEKSSRTVNERVLGAAMVQIDAAFEFVRSRITRREVVGSESVRAATEYEYPMHCLREMLVNAVVHRDYSRTASHIHLRLFSDRIEISSPGRWVGVELSDQDTELSALAGESEPRNRALAHALSCISYFEGDGGGIPAAVDDSRSLGAPQPVVRQENGHVKVTIWPRPRDVRAVVSTVSRGMGEGSQFQGVVPVGFDVLRHGFVVGRIPSQPVNFVTREMKQTIDEWLGRGVDSPIVVVSGMRGAGKTQLVADLVRERVSTGDGWIGWVNAESTDAVNAGLAEIADRLGIADPAGDSVSSANRLRDYLTTRPERGLLIFDNASDPDYIESMLPAGGGTQVVITTTIRDFGQFGATVALDVFNRKQSLEYLEAAIGFRDQVGADRIANALGDLPLALSAAAATISGRHLDCDQYLRLLHARSLPMVLARRRGHPYPRSVEHAILLSVETVERPTGDPRLDRIVSPLMNVIAMLTPSGVHRRFLPDFDGRVDEALQRCVEQSLLVWSATGDRVVMHRLVARVLRERARDNGTAVDLVVSALSVVRSRLFEYSQAWQRREEGNELIEHIAAIDATGMVDNLEVDQQTRLLELRRWAVGYLIAIADTGRSINLAVDILDQTKRILGHHHPYTLDTCTDLARAYQSAGQLNRAVPLFDAVLRDSEQVLGEHHPDTLSSRNNLAVTYESAGRFDEAVPLFERVVVDRERVLGEHHPDTLSSRNNLAVAYKSAGRFDEAVPLFERVVVDRERILGEHHPDTLSSRNNLAAAYESAGRYDEAIALHADILIDRVRVLGSDHPDVLMTRNNLAYTYQSSGRLEDAIPLFESAATDLDRVLGSDHPNTLTARNNLADVYRAVGMMERAIGLFESTLTDAQRTLGADHPLTVTVRGNLAEVRPVTDSTAG
ncbi:FxSxx-COOH system tetratricopeptide repeat protein [Nocardia asiatica]|uniref:FxSxx-COOH system tetratricopeptide repeat protein n=1 Tax=Nocardia asiatica TaxID=209252 RepID=UPI002458A228|nr:FxSxx-COOH system tetratricopeptide repeat protein [Nocardia asiatica]